MSGTVVVFVICINVLCDKKKKKSCKEFLTVKFPIIFKLFRHRVNASSNFATVTFSSYSKCAGIV